MRAQDIMTTDVITVTPNTAVREVAKLMTSYRISGVPVIDEAHQLVGMVTDGDLFRRAELGTEKQPGNWLRFFGFPSERVADYVEEHGHTARDVMTTDVIAVAPATTLRQIADLFETKRIRRVPVVADGVVVGIVSRANLVQALATIATHDVQGADDDRKIRDLVIAEYKRLPCCPPSEWNVIVKDVVVHLWGMVTSPADLAALRVAAEGVPGVRRFVDGTFGYSGEVGNREDRRSNVTIVQPADAASA